MTKYTADGTKARTRLSGGAGSEFGQSVATDSDGSVYVGGHSYSASIDGQASSGGADGFVTKYTADGTKAWTRLAGGAGDDYGQSVATGADGSVYVGGYSHSGSIDGQASNGGVDGFVTKFSSKPEQPKITFAAGSSTATLVVQTTADQVTELPETLTVLVLAGDGYALGTTAEATGTIADKPASPAGQSVIDLGSYGQLIAPVQVQGKWYYFWDRSGDGTASEADWTSHDVLDSLFNRDNAGMINTTDANADSEFGTTDTYRYATLNGVHLALPTLNGEGGVSAETAASTGYTLPWSGTEYTDAGSATNGTTGPYADFTAIWDAYNGTSTESGTSGVPPAWPTSGGPLTATPGGNGHLVGALHSGGVWGGADDSFSSYYVALQVL